MLPLIGQFALLQVNNYVPNAPAINLYGLAPANVAFPGLGITVLNDALASQSLTPVNQNTLQVGIPIPGDTALCGGQIYCQVFVVDGGAPNGLGGHTQGVQLVLGSY